MYKNKLLIMGFLLFIVNTSYGQEKVYKCIINGEVSYSNNEKDNKCKKVEMMEINKFNPSKSSAISSKELIVKNNTQVKGEVYPEPIALDFVPEKPEPIDEKEEKKKFYQQKINQIEKSYLNMIDNVLKIRK